MSHDIILRHLLRKYLFSEMDNPDSYKFALVFSLSSKLFQIIEIDKLKDWSSTTFDQFVDGERIYCDMRTTDTQIMTVTVLQLGKNEESLEETKRFCEILRNRKNFSIEYIRFQFKPLRTTKRQSLPPVQVR